ncbi:MAG: DUF2147 domain-containing protein [Gammaproteobacteria bacterium]
MKKVFGSIFGLFFVAFLFMSSTTVLAATPNNTSAIPTPVGSWQTIDDVTNQPRSIILISLGSNNQLSGRLTKINYRPGEGPGDLCVKCTGSLHNQKILGMTILTGMKQDASNSLRWTDGKIVDPESGKIYSCRMTLSADGNTLHVRGYILFTLLGRTQTWHRVS